MLDEKTVRGMMAHLTASLAELERERDTQIRMLEMHRKWLVDHGYELESGPQLADAVIAELQSAAPQALHSTEVWNRIKHLNPQTENENVVGAVDLALLVFERRGEVERVGPRTYRWVASLNGAAGKKAKKKYAQELQAAGVEKHRLTPLSFESSILEIIRQAKNPKLGMTFEEVLTAAQSAGLNPRSTNLKHGVYNALNNLRRHGKINKPKRGFFAPAVPATPDEKGADEGP